MEQTALLGVSLAQLVRAGALVYAKREFLSHKKYLSPSPAASEGDSEAALLRSGSGHVSAVVDGTIHEPFRCVYGAGQLTPKARDNMHQSDYSN